MFGFALMASILVLTTACDKRGGDKPLVGKTSLANKPRALLLLFGERSDPRMIPLALLTDGKIRPITLDAAGWKEFDKSYFAPGTRLSLYQDGTAITDAVVRRGMWNGTDAPLYKLPGCQALRPLAAVTVDSSVVSAVSLELLATSEALPTLVPRAAATPADLDSARALAIRVAQHEGLTSAARSELDEVVQAINTGATPHPTLVGSFMERGSGLNGKPRHVFMLGDYVDSTHMYLQSFVHVPGDSVREFRRMIDHLDVTGDGVDEIAIEGWHNGGDSYLIFLQYQNGHWRELARGATSWCADRK
ncbi:MAG: hypothetical protein JWM95_2686 [Gemmatimonadetes bacterium]|nr:hypothetical protein [Gemmatimonadota bacterium]